jgi:hypothetical protein
MPSMQIDRPEPEREVVLQSEIPPPKPISLPKRFWDSVVRHLALLDSREALKLTTPEGDSTMSMKSSIATAAARAGVRVKIVIRGAQLHVWQVGVRPRKRYRPPRAPFPCAVCQKPVIPHRSGAGNQKVCSGPGRRKSECQNILRCARVNGITIPEAAERIRAHRAKMAARQEQHEDAA